MLAFDIRQAVRTLLRAPGVNFLTVLLLGAGIGLATTAFSFANAVFLRPLPFRDPDRLVRVEQRASSDGTMAGPVLAEVSAASSFEATGAWKDEFPIVDGPVSKEQVVVARVTAGWWRTLGVGAAVGRTPDEAASDAESAQVVVLGHTYWMSQFGGDTDVVGRTLRIDGDMAVIVGVMPEGFAFPERTRMWRPLRVDVTTGSGYRFIARLRDGATVAKASTELELIGGRLDERLPVENGKHKLVVRQDLIVRDRGLGPLPWVAVGVALLILLIACSNIAGILLVRGVRRRREMAVRSAIGGSRGRLIRQVLLESAVLVVAGGVVGATVAVWGMALLGRVLWRMPDWIQFGVDGRVIGFVAGTVLFIVAAVGLAPALEGTRVQITTPLRGGGVGSTSTVRSRRLGRIQSVMQVAFAFSVVLMAVLLGRSFTNMHDLDFGVDADRVLGISINPVASPYTDPHDRVEWIAGLARQARDVVGVADVAIAARPDRLRSQPVDANLDETALIVNGQTYRVQNVSTQAVTPNYFDVLGLAINAGRPFADTDGEGAEPVVILSRAMARILFPNNLAIGRTLRFGDNGPVATVVGVAGDQNTFYSNRRGIDSRALPLLYVPFDQVFPGSQRFLARTSATPTTVTLSIIAALGSPDLPLSTGQIQPISDEYGAVIREVGWMSLVVGAFAAAALGLALLGIYGVIAFRTAERTREIGIRRALGADRDIVLRMVLSGGARLAIIGVLIGAPVAILSTALLRVFLYRVSGTDPIALAVTASLFLATTLLATAIPARRAARIEPADALKDVT